MGFLLATFHPDFYIAVAGVFPVLLLTIALSRDGLVEAADFLVGVVEDFDGWRDRTRERKGRPAKRREGSPEVRVAVVGVFVLGMFLVAGTFSEVMAVFVLLLQGSDTFVDAFIVVSFVTMVVLTFLVVGIFGAGAIVEIVSEPGGGPREYGARAVGSEPSAVPKEYGAGVVAPGPGGSEDG
jgi:hypothetical protein